jgi:hypothetical protein
LRFVAAYAAAPPTRSSHQGKPEPDLPALLTGLGVGVGVAVPKIITRAVSTRFGVAETKPRAEAAVDVWAGRETIVCVSVAVGKTKPPLPPCPPLDDGGSLEVFVQTGGTGVLEGVTPGSKVGLGVFVAVGEGVFEGVSVSDGVTPGASVSVAVGVAVSVSVGEGVIVPVGENVSVGTGVSVADGEGVKVSVGTGVNVFVETGGGGEL